MDIGTQQQSVEGVPEGWVAEDQPSLPDPTAPKIPEGWESENGPDVQVGGGGQPTRITVRPHKEGTAEEGEKKYSAPEAIVKGATQAATFGLRPALGGLVAAGGGDPMSQNADYGSLLSGGFKMLGNAISSHPDPEVFAAYERGRKASLEDQDAAKEQHRWAYFTGQLAGSLMAPPGGGALAPAAAGARFVRGAIAGGVTGGLQGAGEAVGEGKSASDVAKEGAIGTFIGAPLGGAFGTAIGPRVQTASSPGQRAARYADQTLKAPIPKGLASDSATANATTSKLRSVPFFGSRIGAAVDRTQEAAGEAAAGIANAAGGHTERSIADTLARPGLQGAVDNNRQTINAGYNNLRSQINQNQRYTMPQTDAVLNDIMRVRSAAGHTNPAQGLEQYRNVAGGAPFMGAHRARADARDAGDVLSPHPGYNSADFNRLTRAMTGDLRNMAAAAATNQTPAGRATAIRAFDEAEQRAGPLIEQNKALNRLISSKGEGSIASLLTAAKERGGNLQLLSQLRNSMSPQDFQAIGGTLIHELGQNAATGQFSLSKFATDWNKISEGAKRVMFDQAHLRHLEEIANLGSHLKGSLRESNVSHTAGALILLDAARDAIMLGVGVGTGAISGVGAISGAALAATGVLVAHWMSSPAHAASISAWSRAYQAVGLSPTPARIAMFNIATRNLSSTLGVPIDRLKASIANHLTPSTEQPTETTRSPNKPAGTAQ
jgi:hypothetical protein